VYFVNYTNSASPYFLTQQVNAQVGYIWGTNPAWVSQTTGGRVYITAAGTAQNGWAFIKGY
jgi:hypothetical protein